MMATMTNEHVEEPTTGKGTRLLGKWDYSICALLTIVAGLGDHTLLMGTAGIEYALGRFIGILLIWTVIKMVFLWIREKIAR